MSSPSFLVRLRSRNRRQGTEGHELALVEQLPDDHWHAGDPRMAAPALDGALALAADDVPLPRKPLDARRVLSVVPQVDVRDALVDLTGSRPVTAPLPVVDVDPDACSETSTWLG